MRTPVRSVDMPGLTRADGTEDDPALEWGFVGHVEPITGLPEPSPAYVFCQNGQWLVEVRLSDGDEVVARLGLDGAGAGFGSYIDLGYDDRVILAEVGGAHWAIIGVVNDGLKRTPDTVCGVVTGASAAVPGNDAPIPGPQWRFMKLRPGALLAIETQIGGDILIHSGGSVEIKAGPTGAVHLNGSVRMGVGPLVPPIGAVVGPSGTAIPGVPAVPDVPLPKTPNTPAPPATIVPYVGFADGVIRAKDGVQSHIGVDPDFWAWIIGVHTYPLLLAWLSGLSIVDPPIAIHSEHSGLQGPGSQHTASD